MRWNRIAFMAVGVVFAMGASACSSSSTKAESTTTTSTTSEATGAGLFKVRPAAGRPTGPAAVMSGPLSGGKGIFLASGATLPSLSAAGYSEAEYAASGTAGSYTAADLPTDGNFRLETGPTADYETRVVVRRPTDPKKFSGTVVIEWLNVSGGVDAAPDYTYLDAEILRRGDVWVGVSAQRIGIEGGPVAVLAPGAEGQGAGKGLKAIDPTRYGQLHHPGDAFSDDIFTQVAQSVWTPGKLDPLQGLHAKQVLAVGESQSAFELTTYYDGVQPLTHEFDGFLIHSRGGAAAPLGAPGTGIDITGTVGGQPTKFRTDQSAPIITVETESDVLGVLNYYPAVQPDNSHLRLWEVAGTAHADQVQVGTYSSQLGCSVPINSGQQIFVLRSALRHLSLWAAGGAAPPAARFDIDTTGPKPAYELDANGNVKGGVRTPSVDAPIAALSGIAPAGSSLICLLMGSTIQLSATQLAGLYPSRSAYVKDYAIATDSAIHAGFVLPQDRPAVVADSHPNLIAS